jgi:Transposase
MITAYREPDRATGRKLMQELIESVSSGVPRALVTPGRTLKKRAADVLAYFGRPGTSNGPTEAINGRLEHLRGSALGFRNLTNYIARSWLETGGLRPQLHPRSRRAAKLRKPRSNPLIASTLDRSRRRADRTVCASDCTPRTKIIGTMRTNR